MHAGHLALVALAGFAAGALNALAGGGTLLSFPALLAVGLPALSANATSTIALSPAYLAAALAQHRDLRGQRARLIGLLPLAALGGLLGALLLLRTSVQAFANAVPVLILLACGLLAVQERVRAALLARARRGAVPGAAAGAGRASRSLLLLLVAAGAVYGGYFGAGMSVIVLAALGLAIDDTLPRLNALKQVVAAAANAAAAAWLALHAVVDWRLVAILGLGAACGGAWGGRLAGRMSAVMLRRIVVALGLAVAVIYLLRRR